MANKNQTYFLMFLQYLAVMALLFYAIIPVLAHDFVTQDQWRNFTYDIGLPDLNVFGLCKSRIAKVYYLTGRPLVFWPECVEHALVDKLSTLKFLRVPNFIIMAITSLVTAKVFVDVTHKTWQSMLFAIPLVFSPGYTMMFNQGLTAAGVISGSCFALCSVPFMLACVAEKNYRRKNFLYGTGLLLLGLLNYPAFALIVVPVVYFICAFSDRYSGLERLIMLIKTYFVYGIACMIYAVSIKLFILTQVKVDLGIYNFGVASLPLMSLKVVELFNEVLRGGYLVNLKVSSYALLFFVFLSAFLIPQEYNKNGLLIKFVSATIYLFLFPIVAIASAAPVIVSNFPGVGFRQLVPGMFMMGFCVFFCLIKIANIYRDNKLIYTLFTGLVLILSVSIASQQYKLNSHLARAGQVEINAVKNIVSSIKDVDVISGLHIHVIRPQLSDNNKWGGVYTSGEFAPGSSQNPAHFREIFNMAFRQKFENAEFLKFMSFRDCRLDLICAIKPPRPYEVILTQSYVDSKSYPWVSHNAKVINLTNIFENI